MFYKVHPSGQKSLEAKNAGSGSFKLSLSNEVLLRDCG